MWLSCSHLRLTAWLALLVLLAGILVAFPAAAVASSAITVTVNGQPLKLDVPPVFQGNTLLVPLRPLSEALNAALTWDEAGRTAKVETPQNFLWLTVGQKEAVYNGKRIKLSVPLELRNGRLVVPLRFLAEALEAQVTWHAESRSVSITAPLALAPQRTYNAAFPARVAFTSRNRLFLLDGTRAVAEPVPVSRDGTDTVLGWSPDGEWLAYLHRAAPNFYSAEPYLWVVRADGSGARQVDPRPVNGEPAWSPRQNVLAYSTATPGNNGSLPDDNLKLAALTNGQVRVTCLLPDKTGAVMDYAWLPDGGSLTVALRRTATEPLRIQRVTLQGERRDLLNLGQTGITPGAIHASYALGLRWSPDGRYLAYYLHPNSASLAADGVELQVLDTQGGGPPRSLGTALGYRPWLAWSPDSKELAFIAGGDRLASAGKRLHILDVTTGTVRDAGRDGQVDSQPVWLPTPGAGLLFCRGPENASWEPKENGLWVPGQCLWQQDDTGQVHPVTESASSPPVVTADYYPTVSSDGQNLIFLCLLRGTVGCLYYQPLAGGRPVELIHGLQGSSGYYGNYYPAWVSIYFFPGAGHLEK